MNQAMTKLKQSPLKILYESFTPASRAAILFAIPFTVVDAIHYYTAGTTLIFSFPLLALIYLLCGGLAAKITYQEALDSDKLPAAGSSAGLRLWLTSTVINTIVVMILGFASLGVTLLGGAVYLCVFAPFHALGSAMVGWLGGWFYQQYAWRTKNGVS